MGMTQHCRCVQIRNHPATQNDLFTVHRLGNSTSPPIRIRPRSTEISLPLAKKKKFSRHGTDDESHRTEPPRRHCACESAKENSTQAMGKPPKTQNPVHPHPSPWMVNTAAELKQPHRKSIEEQKKATTKSWKHHPLRRTPMMQKGG